MGRATRVCPGSPQPVEIPRGPRLVLVPWLRPGWRQTGCASEYGLGCTAGVSSGFTDCEPESLSRIRLAAGLALLELILRSHRTFMNYLAAVFLEQSRARAALVASAWAI